MVFYFWELKTKRVECKIVTGGKSEGYDEKEQDLPVLTVFTKADHEAARDIAALPLGIYLLFRRFSHHDL